MDDELLSMRQFELYEPIDQCNSTRDPGDGDVEFMKRASMVLDGVTLTNLEVIENATNGTLEGTLLERLDNCHTPFGK